jgi:N-acetylglutamate synthase-like GNAT family acetyltransferase
MNVRNAEIADAAAIARLLTQLGYPSTARDVRERLTYWVADQASRVLVSAEDGRVVGCLSLGNSPPKRSALEASGTAPPFGLVFIVIPNEGG